MKFVTIFDPKRELDFVGFIPTAIKIGIALPVISIALLVTLGIPWGLDFSGGTEMQVKFDKAVDSIAVRDALAGAGFEKNRVQQFGAAEENELLIRIERLTLLTDEHAEKIKKLVQDSVGQLAFGGSTKADDVKVHFSVEEGDRMTVWLPEPKATAPAAKNANADQIREALTQKLGAADAEDKKPLDDAGIDALAARFDRAALAKTAREAGWLVIAALDKQSEPRFDEAVRLEKLLGRQQTTLAKILDEKSGAKLRRTKDAKTGEESITDAIARNEPYQGKVKYVVQFRGVSVNIEKALVEKFGSAEIRRVEFVDAQVAKQLQTDGALAVLIALLFILVYVAVRFDIFFSPGAVIALIHDAIGALLVFTALRVEFDLPSVAALLTVVGYSINNTIVIYDRIRETLPVDPKRPLTDDEIRGHVNKAVNDTFSRTINTTLTTLFASAALLLLAGGVVQNFAGVLSVGIILGAFSSTFLAPATYLFFRKNFHKPEEDAQSKKGGISREDKARGIV